MNITLLGLLTMTSVFTAVQSAVCTGQKVDCSLPIDQGTCEKALTRWGFEGRSCRKFNYTGCGGNENHFYTEKQCENACIRADCNLSEEPGQCSESITRWTHRNGQCVEFTYTGCGGNDNHFFTKAQCEVACINVCEQPLEFGTCMGYFRMYGYADGACKSFIWGGCGGNANRFYKQEECEAECMA